MRKLVLFFLLLSATPYLSFSQSGIKITHGPYLQSVGETEATIVWTTNNNATAWVELAPDDESHFYAQERPKHYAVKDGFKNVSTIHNVKLEGLEPGVKYRYRVYSQEVTSHVGTNVQYGKVAATGVYRQKPLAFRTLSTSKTEATFAIINDIHGKNDVMENLLGQLKWDETDLVFFNGDMADNLVSEEQMFGAFVDTGVKLFASETPMFYARGNHETRGNFAIKFADYFPTNSGELYYMFRQGPICFVVLDGGEDKPDSDIEYSGIVAFDDFRTKQAKWLQEVLKSPTYRDAPYKVIVCHIPPFSGWHGPRDIAKKFVPILNEAKAQIMISGHLHRHMKKEPEAGSHNFPVLVNSNVNMVKASANNERLQIDVVDQAGKIVDSITIKPDR